MNETIKNIKERRSIRKYKDKEISKEILEELIDCARLAPSGRNEQPWEFVIITNKETLKKVGEIVTTGHFIKDAAACIIVCGKENGHLVEDGCAATENIHLAAHSLGLGTCWVAGVNRDYNDAAKKILGIPDDIDMVSFIPLGYPDEEPSIRSRKSLQEVIHWEKY